MGNAEYMGTRDLTALQLNILRLDLAIPTSTTKLREQ